MNIRRIIIYLGKITLIDNIARSESTHTKRPKLLELWELWKLWEYFFSWYVKTYQTRESEISRMELKVVVHLSGQELLFSGLSGLKGPFHWL